jgi:hypothetical protein
LCPGAGFEVCEGGEPYQAHQAPHALAIDLLPLGPQHRGHPARAEERPGQEQLVEPAHDHELARIGSRSRSVEVFERASPSSRHWRRIDKPG